MRPSFLRKGFLCLTTMRGWATYKNNANYFLQYRANECSHAVIYALLQPQRLTLCSTLQTYRYIPCNNYRNARFFLRSGFPFLTVPRHMSPGHAPGTRFKRAPHPKTEKMYRFFAPVLSAQLITDALRKPRDMRNLVPPTDAFNLPIL